MNARGNLATLTSPPRPMAKRSRGPIFRAAV
jgi:hypothetical protein